VLEVYLIEVAPRTVLTTLRHYELPGSSSPGRACNAAPPDPDTREIDQGGSSDFMKKKKKKKKKIMITMRNHDYL